MPDVPELPPVPELPEPEATSAAASRSLIRARNRHQLHPVASAKKINAASSARSASPPVAVATITSTTAMAA